MKSSNTIDIVALVNVIKDNLLKISFLFLIIIGIAVIMSLSVSDHFTTNMKITGPDTLSSIYIKPIASVDSWPDSISSFETEKYKKDFYEQSETAKKTFSSYSAFSKSISIITPKRLDSKSTITLALSSPKNELLQEVLAEYFSFVIEAHNNTLQEIITAIYKAKIDEMQKNITTLTNLEKLNIKDIIDRLNFQYQLAETMEKNPSSIQKIYKNYIITNSSEGFLKGTAILKKEIELYSNIKTFDTKAIREIESTLNAIKNITFEKEKYSPFTMLSQPSSPANVNSSKKKFILLAGLTFAIFFSIIYILYLVTSFSRNNRDE